MSTDAPAKSPDAATTDEPRTLELADVHVQTELCQFTGAPRERFDRGDALVWAMAELGGYRSPAVTDEPLVHQYTDAPVAGVVRWAAADEWSPASYSGT